jgi:hypothetical protein
MVKEVPARAELKKEIDVIGRLGEVNELDNVGVVDQLPGLHLVLQSIDEVLLGQRLVLRQVNLIDQIFLLNHLAGQNLPRFSIYCEVGLGKASLAQLLVFYRVVPVYNFQRMRLFHSRLLIFYLNFTPNIFFTNEQI